MTSLCLPTHRWKCPACGNEYQTLIKPREPKTYADARCERQHIQDGCPEYKQHWIDRERAKLIHAICLPPSLWKIGDIVSRDGNDEQQILSIDGGEPTDGIRVRCIKAPPIYAGHTAPWCKVGDEEDNIVRRYIFIRPAHQPTPPPKSYLTSPQ